MLSCRKLLTVFAPLLAVAVLTTHREFRLLSEVADLKSEVAELLAKVGDANNNGDKLRNLARGSSADIDVPEGVPETPEPEKETTLEIDHIQETQREAPSWAHLNATAFHPYIAETHYHHGVFPIEDIVLGGPAKPYFPKGADQSSDKNLFWPAKNSSEAVCTLRKDSRTDGLTLSGQFPHHLQQLLTCFTWWQLNPSQKPVLHLERSYDQKTKEMQTEKKEFIRSFHKALQEVFDVRIDVIDRVSKDPNVTVRATWSPMHKLLNAYGKQHKHVQILLFSWCDRHYNVRRRRHPGCSE